MTPKSEFGSRVKFFFWKFSLEMIQFILIRNPNEILRVKLSKLGFHFQNFIPYKKQPNYKFTANSVNLTRDLGSILRPSQDKSLLVISIIRKRLGLNRIVGNFDGKSPFFLYERPSRAHVVNTREALRPRKARQRPL